LALDDVFAALGNQVEARRVCAWCRQPIPVWDRNTCRAKRRDARTCSKACRQALSRFRIGRAEAVAGGRPMRFAYADPPYPGLAKKYYGCSEVDHRELVDRLVRDYPDGWALSTSASALQAVLALCPLGVRICPFVKGSRPTAARRALCAWEALLVYRGRSRPAPVFEELTDVLVWGGRQHSHPGALTGMKPAPFAEWMFRLLGAQGGDALDDLFPGSGAIGRAWELYTSPSPAPGASRLAGAMRRLQDQASPGSARDGLEGAGA
jgi:hypothetical protein